MFDFPARRIADPKLSLQLQRRDPILCMSDQINSLEPFGQRQLGGVKDCSCCCCRLVATLIALVPFAAVIVDHAEALTLPTPRATKALRPAAKLQCLLALLLSPEGLDEIGEGKPLLVLDLVLGHEIVLK